MSNLILKKDDDDVENKVDDFEDEPNDVPDEELSPEELMLKQQVIDLYEEIKNKVETKNTTLEHIIHNEMKF